MDGKTKQPKFMFDPAKFGSKAFMAGDYGKKEMILVNGVNAVPFDPNAGWKEGDILPHDDDKALKVGGVYSIGFAVHDDNMTGRGHHVSYVKTLGIGAKADIQAVKLN
jgi:hypothetical protein